MEYFKIGKIVSTHGVAGKMLLQHSLGLSTDFKNTEAIFFEETEQSFMPWFLVSAEALSEAESYIQVEGIDSREEARKYLRKEVWLLEKDFQKLASQSAFISLLGYHIIEKKQNLGTILEVIEQPHQTLCRIDIGTSEAWIPLHAETLLQIDRKKKQVHVRLPEGLIDVYR